MNEVLRKFVPNPVSLWGACCVCVCVYEQRERERRERRGKREKREARDAAEREEKFHTNSPSHSTLSTNPTQKVLVIINPSPSDVGLPTKAYVSVEEVHDVSISFEGRIIYSTLLPYGVWSGSSMTHIPSPRQESMKEGKWVFP